MLNHYILPNQQRTVKAHMPLEKTTAEQTKRKWPLREYWPEQKNTSQNKTDSAYKYRPEQKETGEQQDIFGIKKYRRLKKSRALDLMSIPRLKQSRALDLISIPRLKESIALELMIIPRLK